MSTTLVSILSENNIPTYLFIKQMEGRFDKHIFLITKEIDKGKTDSYLAKALGGWNSGKFRRIIIDPDNYAANMSWLAKSVPVGGDDNYIVNLTGGTKPMSLAAFSHFSKFEGTRFYYMSSDSTAIYDFESKEKFVDVTFKIPLADYLGVYGLKIQSQEDECNRQKKRSYEIFSQFKAVNFNKNNFPLIGNAQGNANMDGDERSYLTGAWFEQFSYYKIRKALGLDGTSIAQSAKVTHVNNDDVQASQDNNEMDIIFVKDNVLYTVECKVGLGSTAKNAKNNIHDAQYKAAAIAKYLGFRVRSYIFWLQDMSMFTKDDIEFFKKNTNLLGLSGIVTGAELSKDDDSFLNPKIR